MSSAGLSASWVAVPEVARMTIRQLLGRRRTLLLLLLAAIPILLSIIFRLADQTDIRSFTNHVFNTVSLTIVLPIVAVLFGTGAFGAENDDGTIVYLLAKPVTRWVIVAAKAVSAAVLVTGLTVGSVALAGAVDLLPAGGDGASATWACVVAMVVGSLCYVALFIALSLFTRRALLIGIGYVLVWEGALSSLLPGIANLSVRQYALGAASAVYPLNNDGAAPRVPPETAFALALAVIVVALLAATWRLMRFELPGGTD